MNAPEQTASRVDVMNGDFVPNLSMGPPIVNPLRTVTRLPLEGHRVSLLACPHSRCREACATDLAADSAIDVKPNYRGNVSTQVVTVPPPKPTR